MAAIPADDPATIIFSSGSTGDPGCDARTTTSVQRHQIGQLRVGCRRSSRHPAVLPSFGFTATLALPGLLGAGAIYHVNPLDARVVGALAREQKATFLLATPTFLQTYMRRCAPEDFGSLKIVMAGAEKLPERVATAFEEHFGIRPLEGYGCSECSPVVTVSTPDFRAAGFRQVSQARKIGHPVPGMSVRIVDPETGEPRAPGEPGLLLVQDNGMKGYLGQPEKTASVLRDGWYTTGTWLILDADGFLQITDRLSRFSKIGGEMVPHVKVEDTLQDLSGETERAFAVTAVPDEKKGERLMVLHTLREDALKSCPRVAGGGGFAELWVPRANQFVHVEAAASRQRQAGSARHPRHRAGARGEGSMTPQTAESRLAPPRRRARCSWSSCSSAGSAAGPDRQPWLSRRRYGGRSARVSAPCTTGSWLTPRAGDGLLVVSSVFIDAFGVFLPRRRHLPDPACGRCWGSSCSSAYAGSVSFLCALPPPDR
jgi:acyl-CoA synthetase (AMP-forming)/AMP-acid ligase II